MDSKQRECSSSRSYKIETEGCGCLKGSYAIPGGVAQSPVDSYPLSRDIFVGRHGEYSLYAYIFTDRSGYYVGHKRPRDGVEWLNVTSRTAASETGVTGLFLIALKRAKSLGIVKES